MIIVAVLLGIGFGLSLFLILYGLFPPEPTLAETLAALRRTPPPPPVAPSAVASGWAGRLGRPGLRLLADSGLPSPRARKDLAILGRATEAYLAEKILAAFLGLLLPVLIAGMLAAAGHSVSPVLPAVAAVVCAVGGFFVPDAALHSQAVAARRDFRHALAGFLDLAEAALAGGAGIERALSQAADTGTGPAFHALRKALAAATITARPAHDALAQLGNELGVAELVETAGAFTLAGTEGSKIRTSLTTKADSLREHDLADTEADAAAATERMAAPLVLTFAGFLLVLAYPATMHVMGAL